MRPESRRDAVDRFLEENVCDHDARAWLDRTLKITITSASYVFRRRFLDFTGEYVLHCHFLGHEDRGMMFAVQTVSNGPKINPQS